MTKTIIALVFVLKGGFERFIYQTAFISDMKREYEQASHDKKMFFELKKSQYCMYI